MKKTSLYIGVDVGGTKIRASLTEESGAILASHKSRTPRQQIADVVIEAIEDAIKVLLQKKNISNDQISAIGVALPGVVDTEKGIIVVAPNLGITNVDLLSRLTSTFQTPIVLGNDCNLGALGEKWLGSAKNAKSVVSILVGTGIGGGIVFGNKLWTGSRESAAEIGHIVMEIGGPRCNCGNRGCLESLASRTAIERDIRQAVSSGRKTILTELLEGGDLSLIRSGVLKQALNKNDELVTEVMKKLAQVLGYACITVRHLIDPEVIVLGGGVIEACGSFVLPIVQEIVDSDKLAGARKTGPVLVSALGNDAVVLGAVALARIACNRNPFDKKYHVEPKYPKINDLGDGKILIGDKRYDGDIYVLVNGKVKSRKKYSEKERRISSHAIATKELEKICSGGPEVVFIGTGQLGRVEVDDETRIFFQQRAIQCRALPTPTAIEAYNESKTRRAILLHTTC